MFIYTPIPISLGREVPTETTQFPFHCRQEETWAVWVQKGSNLPMVTH